MAFVLVQHLDPQHESMLTEIVARTTAMSVKEAEDGMVLDANQVFVIPPDATLTINGGALNVSKPAPPRDRRRPIDSFFLSLAEDQGENAVCIILSGFGSDGTLGLTAIKESGGLTLTQAEFDHMAMSGMPSSATATGMVDYVLPVEQMPATLISYQKHLNAVETRKDADGTRQDATGYLPVIFTLVRDRLGHDFSGYKQNTVIRRIQRRMQVLQIDNIPAYVERLRQDPEQIDLLFRDLLIGVTQFFRDPAAFAALADKVIPKLLAGKSADDQVRVWVSGCATGEEAYSIAILLHEALSARDRNPKIVIFGTDIDDRAVTAARAGNYRKSMMRGLSPQRLARWFVGNGDFYHPIPQIRESCVFSVHNIVKDPPFSKLDLISCRNLLIYLDAGLQNRLVPLFHYALVPGGTLLLGPSEIVDREGEFFAVLDRQNRLFTRRDRASPLPVFPISGARGRSTRSATVAPRGNIRRLLERYAPAYVVIDEHRDVVQFSEQIGKYLGPAPGKASLNLLALARREMRPALRSAMRDAVSGRRRVVRDNVPLHAEDGDRVITVIVEPIPGPLAADNVYLVAFQELERGAEAGEDVHPIGDRPAIADGQHQADSVIESRLRAAIEQADAANEELRSANEEYQSVNEELQSTNEELETTKEEIQSINEELQTVNAELHSKNDALLQSNSDLQNLLDSTEIATLFLSEDLSIRNFTPAMLGILPLRNTDIGRPVTDIVNPLNYKKIADDVREVVRRLAIIEREVAIPGSRIFQMRIRPYRKVNRVVDGVVVTFVDISERASADEHRKMLMAELDHRVKNMLTTVQSLAMQTGHSAPTMEAFLESFEARLDSLAKTHNLLMQHTSQAATLRDLVDSELSHYATDGAPRYFAVGGDIVLSSRRAMAIGMMLHELATNAAKYGALSLSSGTVRVSWITQNGLQPLLHLEWSETGGPPVEKSARRGFGSRLIERGLARELSAHVDLVFDPNGVRCTIDMPLAPDTGEA